MDGSAAKLRRARMVESANRVVSAFNTDCPVGTDVVYEPVRGTGRNLKRTRVEDSARIMGGHTAVCFLFDVRGCVDVEHVCPRGIFEKVYLGNGSVEWDEDFEHLWEITEPS
jgi:hypothetical protein